MATSKQSKSKLFIVRGIEGGFLGPDETDLALCLAGRREKVIFPVVGHSYIGGRVVGMTSMSELNPDWIPVWAQKGERWFEIKIEPDDYSQKYFGVEKVAIRYCSGPSFKNHWGIFSTGDIVKVIGELKESIFQIFNNRFPPKERDIELFLTLDGSYLSLFFRESSNAISKKIGESITVDKVVSMDKWPYILIGLDFMTWTISVRDLSTPFGKWKSHRRIDSCPHELQRILDEAYQSFLLAKRDEEAMFRLGFLGTDGALKIKFIRPDGLQTAVDLKDVMVGDYIQDGSSLVEVGFLQATGTISEESNIVSKTSPYLHSYDNRNLVVISTEPLAFAFVEGTYPTQTRIYRSMNLKFQK